MSSSLSALEERSLLLSLEASSPAERSAFVSSFARVNPIAHAALLQSEKRTHPPPSMLDTMAPPLQHGALPGMTLGNSGGRAAEVRAQISKEAQRNPLAITEAQRLMLRAAEAMKQQPAAHATHDKRHSNTSSPASIASSAAALHRRPSTSTMHVPSYKVDPDIVRGRKRQFQMQLYSLLWGECTETDTEGVHPHVSSTKQAQDLFADLNVADVLLYGRTGMVEVPSYAQQQQQKGETDRSTARSGGAPSARSGRAPSISAAPGSSLFATASRGHSSSPTPQSVTPQFVPCSPVEWYFMKTTPASNEKKLCRKVDFDHRHVVPEFENREQETPLLNANATAGTQQHHTASLTASTGKSHKGITKTCEIICERFRLDLSEEEQNAAAHAARLAILADRANGLSQDSSAGVSPTHSRPTTPPLPAMRSPLLLGAGAPRSRAGSVMIPNQQPRGSVMMPRGSVMLHRSPLLGGDGTSGNTLLVPGGGAGHSGSSNQNEEKDSSSQSLMITLDSASSPSLHTVVGQARRPSISPNAALGVGSIAGTPGSRALNQFHQRMQAHGRTDPTQTKLDKQYFNKDDLRTFLRNPYGKGALLKFVISKDSNCELIRATWVDKGPVEEALQAMDPSKPHSKLFSPPSLPRQTAPGFTAPPYAHRHIKFLVQTRTNSFKLNDTGFSFYERTLTYPHPHDHRTPLHDLENEYELSAESSIQHQTAYVKRRRKDKEREDRWAAKQKEKEDEAARRKRNAGTSSNDGEAAASSAAAASATSASADGPADDAASLQVQRSNQHYRIQNYEAGSALYDSLRSVCDKLAAYFDLVLSSAAAATGAPKKKTKKMQLYFRRDACNQLWLLWSDCLEFDDPAGKAAAAADAAAAQVPERSPEYASIANPLRWTGMDASPSSGGVGRSHTLKIHEEAKNAASEEDDEDDYGDDGFSDDESGGAGSTIQEEGSSDDEDDSETEVSVAASTDSDEEAEGGRPSWRAIKRKAPKAKPKQQKPALMAAAEPAVDAEGNPIDPSASPAPSNADTEAEPAEQPSTKTYTCAHCRIVVLKHDVYYVLLHTLLHTYQLENPSKGFFHQRKTEWSNMQWQEAPISLAESKEEARRDLVRQNSQRLHLASATPTPLSSFLERPTSSGGRMSSPASPSGRSVPGSPLSPGSHRKSYSASIGAIPPANFDASATGHDALLPVSASPVSQRTNSSRSLLHSDDAAASSELGGVDENDDAETNADAEESAVSVPSFALFFDPNLDGAGFKALSASPAYLARSVPVCGKCCAHIWMDPLLIRDRFGQSINPIQHPLHNQRSIGAADGSGSGPGPSSTFAWLKKKQMSAWDRDQLKKAVAASEHAASQGNTSAAALMFNEARGGKNFVALNVSAAKSGLHYVSASERKQQRDLSTGEGKDPYTNPHALLNYWAHYSDTKEDRDLALSMQRRLAVAGAPSAAIYQLDASRTKARRRPEDLERVYGMRYVADEHGNGGTFVRSRSPKGSGTASGAASGPGTVRSSADKYRRQNRSAGAVRPNRDGQPTGEVRPATAAASTTVATDSATTTAGASPNRSARTSPVRPSTSSRVISQRGSSSRTRSPPQRDNTFLTGLDPEDQEDALALEEIVDGHKQQRQDAQNSDSQGDEEGTEQTEASQQPPLVEEEDEEDENEEDDVPSLSFSPSNRSRNTSSHGSRPIHTPDTDSRSSSSTLRNHSSSAHTQSDSDLVASVFGGSRMEQRIAEKAQRRADREAREALAVALMHHSSQGRPKSNTDSSLPLSPPTYLPNHEPKSTMSLIFDRPLSPIKGSADRRRMGVETTLSRALRAETWARARQKTEAKFASEAQSAAERLMFARPGVPESLSSHQAPYNIPVLGEKDHRRREARAEAYKSIRRSLSVERLRTQAEYDIESAQYHSSSNIAYIGSGARPASGPVRPTTMQASQSASALARGSSAGVSRSSTSLAAFAYAPAPLPRVGATPAQIMAAKAALVIEATGGLNPPRRHSHGQRPHTAGPQMRSMLYSPATPTRSSPSHRGTGTGGSRSKQSSRPLSPHTSSKLATMDRAYTGASTGGGLQTTPQRGASAASSRPDTASSSSPADWLQRSRLAESQQAAERGSDTRHVLALPAAAAAAPVSDDCSSIQSLDPSIPSSAVASHRSSPPVEEQSIEEMTQVEHTDMEQTEQPQPAAQADLSQHQPPSPPAAADAATPAPEDEPRAE